jgi:hypothetical protein
MRLLHPDLIEEYYNSIKEQYPDLTLQQCNEVCSAPFIEVRKGIESGNLPTVRLKFFGTFIAYPKRVKGILKNLENLFKNHRVSPGVYFKKKEQLEKFLNKVKNESKDKLD